MHAALSAQVRACERAAEGLEAELRLSLPSDVVLVAEAVDLVARHLESSFIDRHTIRFNLRVALAEALANAIVYGNAQDAAKRVAVRAFFGPHVVEVEVSDEGGGFDYRAIPDPTRSFARMRPRGRGLYLIRSLVDEVRFNDTGNAICMILRRD